MNRSVATLVGVGLLASGAEVARAEDTTSLQAILNEAVVTTASKTAETESNAPATSTTITSDELRRFGLRNLADAVNYLSLGMFASFNMATDDVGARGVVIPQGPAGENETGAHILLLINGHMVNEPFAGTARLGRGWGIPLELVDHIEVINGPGSVLYGSNAMLGVINVVTKRAKDYHGLHLIAEGEPFYGARLGAGAGYEFKLFGAPSELTVQAEYAKQDGPDLTFPVINTGINPMTRKPTRYTIEGPGTGIWGGTASHINYADAPAAMLRFVSGDFEFNFRTSAFRYGNPLQAHLTFDEPSIRTIERSIFADAKYHRTLSSTVDLTARVYTDGFDRERFFTIAQGGTYCRIDNCEIHLRALSRWIGSEVQTSFDWLQNARFVSLLGLDGRVRYSKAEGDQLNGLTGEAVAPPGSLVAYNDVTLGAYGQQTWQATPWLGFNAGARLDYDERFPAVLSPRIAATIKPWTSGTLKAIYVEAFRSPTFFESFNAGGPQLPSENLQPETVRSAEASIEQKFGTQRVLFGVFRSWWSDMIALHNYTAPEFLEAIAQGKTRIPFSPSTVIFQYRNVASIDNYGLNAGYDGTVGQALRYGANLTAAIARSEEGGVSHPLVVAPQLYGNARISYDLPDDWPVLGLAAKYFGKRIANNAFQGAYQPLPYAPAQLQLRATISGPVPNVAGLSYRLSADYSFASEGPYPVGPVQRATPAFPQPFLNPITQFQSLIGLQYDFL